VKNSEKPEEKENENKKDKKRRAFQRIKIN
jgi:hypothetical protein